MKVLLEQSGYALDNLGDLAMLKVAAARIRDAWPDCEIHVPTTNPGRLVGTVPGTVPINVGWPGVSMAPINRAGSAVQSVFRPGRPLYSKWGPQVLFSGGFGRAFESADCVISSGGGFVCDAFAKHGVRVLELLSSAQKRGVPTAMFGQGIGPVSDPKLSDLVSRVVPQLDGLGLRVPHAADLPRPSLWGMFGDDALEFAVGSPAPVGVDVPILGVNFRLASYNGASLGDLQELGSILHTWVHKNGGAFQPVPIDLSSGGDNAAITAVLSSGGGTIEPGVLVPDNVESLALAVARCGAVVTMSYHAAVFALGAGVPTICLTSSSYYDGKFRGLQAIFGSDICRVFTPRGLIDEGVERVVRDVIETGREQRLICRESAQRLAVSSGSFYGEVLASIS